jgi:hypothetical protein
MVHLCLLKSHQTIDYSFIPKKWQGRVDIRMPMHKNLYYLARIAKVTTVAHPPVDEICKYFDLLKTKEVD